MPTNFGALLEQAFAKHGQLCVGIDPHAALLEEWGLPDDVSGLEAFALGSLEACSGNVGIIKPQVSFFERFGSRGFAVLEKLANRANETDLVVIMDAKRGDIGTTMAAYFDAWLGRTAPFVCDALTVSPYLGLETFAEIQSECLERGKGIFVLAATSNPEGADLQQARIADSTVAADVFQRLEEQNAITRPSGNRLGSFGAVVGATLSLEAFGIESIRQGCATPILAPGFGAQGAKLANTRATFGAGADSVIHSVSRSVLAAGQHGLSKAIEFANRQLEVALEVQS